MVVDLRCFQAIKRVEAVSQRIGRVGLKEDRVSDVEDRFVHGYPRYHRDESALNVVGHFESFHEGQAECVSAENSGQFSRGDPVQESDVSGNSEFLSLATDAPDIFS